jgi:hypothetical protein
VAPDTSQTKRGPSDATDYSSTKAPETRKEAEEREPQPSDWRLYPGGRLGAPVDTGMSSLDRDVAMSGAEKPGLVDYGESPGE